MDTDAAHRLFVSGPELQAEREDARLTQEQVAAAMGIKNRSTISDYENKAIVKPRIARLYREAIAKLTSESAA